MTKTESELVSLAGSPLSRHFAENPLNRQSGELLWKELLMHGGARDPHQMLRALLGEIGSGSEAGIRAGVRSLLDDMGVTTSTLSG